MDDLIGLLHDAIKELLGQAEELDAILDKNPTAASAETVEKVAKLLANLCKALTQVSEALTAHASPLRRVVERFNGVVHEISVAPENAKAKISEFLSDHRAFLAKIGVPERLIDMVEKELAATVAANDNKLITDKHVFDAAQLTSAIADLRDVVCSLASQAKLLEVVWDPKLLKHVVTGVIGACTIVVDVTAAATAPDFTGVVIFNAIKSTAAGGHKVVKAVKALRKRWDEWKSALKAAQDINILKSKAPKSPFKKKP